MSIILCHNSALEYYRTNASDYPIDTNSNNAHLPLSAAQARQILNIVPSAPEANEYYKQHQSILSLPVHLLVPSKNKRPYLPSVIVCHSAPTQITSGTLRYAPRVFGAQKTYLSGGPLTLCQLANSLSYVQLALICYELCGSYRLTKDPNDASLDGFCRATPITSLKAINSFVKTNHSQRGARHLTAVSKYVADGSASPRESQLAIALCFPTQWGGYNLPIPKLNATIQISDNAKLTSKKQYFSCDMLWPNEKLIIEYDSNQFHTGAQHIASDALRRNILQDMGYTVVTVTNDQLINANKTNELARQLSRRLGIRFRGKKTEPNMARFNLRENLLQH